MTFNTDQPIYLQMANRLCEEILSGKYVADSRIPSVREYASMLQVNVNTAVKAYDELAQNGVIYNKRGLGYFVASSAKTEILKERRQKFMNRILPELFQQMRLLGISIAEVHEAWKSSQETI